MRVAAVVLTEPTHYYVRQRASGDTFPVPGIEYVGARLQRPLLDTLVDPGLHFEPTDTMFRMSC